MCAIQGNNGTEVCNVYKEWTSEKKVVKTRETQKLWVELYWP